MHTIPNVPLCVSVSITARSYAAVSRRHVLLLAHKSPLSLTATGELGGHGQWNPGQRLVRSAQNWVFCSLFMSPGSLLTEPARPSAPVFYCSSDSSELSACRATAGRYHCFTFLDQKRKEDHIVLLAAAEYLIMFESVNACVCVCVCTSFLEGTIKWQDELWSMSCRQNTSALVESESPDGPSPFQATGAGAPPHKERSVSVRIPPRSPARALLTSTTPGY